MLLDNSLLDECFVSLGCGGKEVDAWTRSIATWFGKREICWSSVEMEEWVSFFSLSLLANKSWLWKFVAPDRFFSIKLRKLQTLCFDSDRWIVYYPITMMGKPQNPKFNNCCCLYNCSFIFLHMTGFFYGYHQHSTDISDVLCFPSSTTKYHCTTRDFTKQKYKCRN